MDRQTSGLLFTILIDVTIFTLLFILTVFYRKIRSKDIELSSDLSPESIKKPYFIESTHSMGTLMSQVYTIPKAELPEKLSYLAFLYIELHYLLILVLIGMTVIGLVILIPVYNSGNLTHENNMDRLSMANVITDEDYLIVPIVVLVVFSLMLYLVSYLFNKRCKREQIDVIFI
jgi:hypothetical protein